MDLGACSTRHCLESFHDLSAECLNPQMCRVGQKGIFTKGRPLVEADKLLMDGFIRKLPKKSFPKFNEKLLYSFGDTKTTRSIETYPSLQHSFACCLRHIQTKKGCKRTSPIYVH